MRQGRAGSGARQGQRQGQGQGQEHGSGRAEGQGNARQGQGKGSGMAGRIIITILLSIAPEKGTLDAHKKRSGITYVTYVVVTPLLGALLKSTSLSLPDVYLGSRRLLATQLPPN